MPLSVQGCEAEISKRKGSRSPTLVLPHALASTRKRQVPCLRRGAWNLHVFAGPPRSGTYPAALELAARGECNDLEYA